MDHVTPSRCLYRAITPSSPVFRYHVDPASGAFVLSALAGTGRGPWLHTAQASGDRGEGTNSHDSLFSCGWCSGGEWLCVMGGLRGPVDG